MRKRIFAAALVCIIVLNISCFNIYASALSVDFQFNDAVGTKLAGYSSLWSYSGSTDYGKTIKNGSDGYIKLSSKNTSASYYMEFNASSSNITGSYTVETRVKMLTSDYKMFRIKNVDGSGNETDMMRLTTSADNFGVPCLKDNLIDTNKTLLKYKANDSENVDFNEGWHTFWFSFDAAYQKMMIFIDNTDNFYEYQMSSNGTKLGKIRIAGNSSENGNDMYVDYFKITEGVSPIPVSENYTYYQDFSSYTNGENVLNSAAYTKSNINAVAVTDPKNENNICTMLTTNDSSVYQKCIIPFFSNIKGNVTVEMKLLVNDYSYRHMPTLRSSSNEEMLVTTTDTAGDLRNLFIGGTILYDAIKPGNWVKFRYEINTYTGMYNAFIDDCDYSVKSGYLNCGTDISAISFTIWTGEEATPIYIDDIYASDNNDLVRKQACNFEPAGRDSAISRTLLGNSEKLCFGQSGQASANYYAADIRDAGKYSVVLKVKHSGTGGKTITLKNAVGDLVSLRFEQNNVYIGQERLIGYTEDKNTENPDMEKGWLIFYINIDAMNKQISVYADNLYYSYIVKCNLQNMKPNGISISFNNTDAKDNILYLETAELATGFCIIPGPQSDLYNYGLSFADSSEVIDIPLGYTYEGKFDIAFTVSGRATAELYSTDNTFYASEINTVEATDVRYSFDTDKSTVSVSYGNISNKLAADIKNISRIVLKGNSLTVRNFSIAKGIYYTEKEKAAQAEAGRVLSTYLFFCSGRELSVPRGGYRFDKSSSNTYKKFKLSNINNFTFDGNNSEFWETDYVGAFIINGCERIHLKNVTVDYDPLPFSQGTIYAIDSVNKTFDVEVDSGYAMPTENKVNGNFRLIYYKADNSAPLPITSSDYGYIKEVLGDNKVRMGLNFGDAFKEFSQLSVGDRFLFRTVMGEGNAICTIGSKQCTYENINIYTAPSLAVYETDGYGDNLYKNIIITRRPGTDRLASSSADGFHLRGVIRGSTIDGCEVGFTLDDCVNSYGIFGNVYQKIDDFTYILSGCIPDIKEGYNISFYDCMSWNYKGSARVDSFEEITDEAILAEVLKTSGEIQEKTGVELKRDFTYAFKVKFNKAIDVQHLDYSMSDYKCGDGFTVKNSYFHDSYVRGVLLRSPNSIVENCVFERMNNGAIVLLPERHFNEGPFPTNVTIKNNYIKDSAFCRWSSTNTRYSAAIYINGSPSKEIADVSNMKNITLTDNVIENSGTLPVMITNADCLMVSGNTIDGAFGQKKSDYDGQYHMVYKQWYGMYLSNNKNTVVTENKFNNMPDFIISNVYNSGIMAFTTEADGVLWDTQSAEYSYKPASELNMNKSGGNALLIKPAGTVGSISKKLYKSIDGNFVLEYKNIGTEKDRKISLLDDNGNSVLSLNYTSNLLSVNGAAIYTEYSNDVINYSFAYNDTNKKYEFYRRGALIRSGTIDIPKVNGIQISCTDAVAFKEIKLYEPDIGIYGLVSKTADGTSVQAVNTTGQCIPEVTIYAAIKENGVLKGIESAQLDLNKYSLTKDFNMQNATDIYLWQGMKPICETLGRKE